MVLLPKLPFEFFSDLQWIRDLSTYLCIIRSTPRKFVVWDNIITLRTAVIQSTTSTSPPDFSFQNVVCFLLRESASENRLPLYPCLTHHSKIILLMHCYVMCLNCLRFLFISFLNREATVLKSIHSPVLCVAVNRKVLSRLIDSWIRS